MNSMALEILLHMLVCSGLVWPGSKLQLHFCYTVKFAISPEMEVLDRTMFVEYKVPKEKKNEKKKELFVCGHLLPLLLSSIETKLSSHPKVDHELHMPKDVLTHKKRQTLSKNILILCLCRLIEFSCSFLSYFQSD